MTSPSDPVHKPYHYTRYKLEPVDFILRNNLEFWRGNIIKYVMRAGYKRVGGLTPAEAEIEDLEKAKRYLDMRINLIRGETEL